MIAEYDISAQDAVTLTATRAFADRFEAAAKKAKSPKRVANLITSELTRRLKLAGLELEQSPVTPGRDRAGGGSCGVWRAFEQDAEAAARYVLRREGEDFAAVYEREKPQQISDTAAIEAMIDEVIAANPKQVEQYRGGKKTVAAFFVGQVMRLSKGQANPALLNELVIKKLDS